MTLHINLQTDILAVIDVQNDFLPGGALAVHDGDLIIPTINRLLAHSFEWSFATQDWHPHGHASFASSHPGHHVHDTIRLNYGNQHLWPDHAVQNTKGAEFASTLECHLFKMIIRKGWHKSIDSYSAFWENDQKTSTGLVGWLQHLGFKRIFFTGLAEDFCVAYSAKDAVRAGFEAFIITDATKPVALPLSNGQTTAQTSRKELEALGVHYLHSSELL